MLNSPMVVFVQAHLSGCAPVAIGIFFIALTVSVGSTLDNIGVCMDPQNSIYLWMLIVCAQGVKSVV